MKQIVSQAIVLSRTNFGEAARIVTVLTPDYGKLRLMAKGVRKIKSKLAGGIELFSVSDITFIKGRGEIDTLVSSRLRHHYNHIVEDIDRTMLGYDALKTFNKTTEDNVAREYFDLLKVALQSLDDHSIGLDTINLWLSMRLLVLAGHTPNLRTDTTGNRLQADQKFSFDYDAMAFEPNNMGRFDSRHIKLLRLASQADNPKFFVQLQGADEQILDGAQLAKQLLSQQ